MIGIPTTMRITIMALLIATPIGFYMALARIQHIKFARQIVTLYISFIRGTPIVLQILIVYSLLPSLLNSFIKNIGWDVNIFDINPIIYAYIVFSLNTIASLSEVFRSALLTVNKGQLEAGLSIGLSRAQTYIRIIIPQALVVALPNICNVTINLIKGTSLAFIMTVKDITAIAKVEAAYGYNYIEAYIDVFLVYLIVCAITQMVFKYLENHFGAYRALRIHK
jgi:L-cystine transport system permease protein